MDVVLAVLDSVDPVFLIAVAALVTAVWSAGATRRHNRLSVKPHLAIATWATDSIQKWGIVLSNDGLGPAVVRSYKIFIDGKEIPPSKWADIAACLGEPVGRWEYAAPVGAIKPGDECFLFAVPREVFASESGKFYDILKRIRIRVTYASMYGPRDKCEYVLPDRFSSLVAPPDPGSVIVNGGPPVL